MMRDAIIKIVQKKDLSYKEAYQVMNEMLSGETTPTQNAAFLAALSTKNTKAETIEEIFGCAAAMRNKAIQLKTGFPVMDIVGTGGDRKNSFNISTAAAFVIASAGVKVCKHGNRAASSNCGTADCLEALGVNINEPPEMALSLLKDPGMCFLFAQEYHKSMKYVAPIRKELGFRTVFNILGPLTNPAHPEMMVLGVYDGSLVVPIANVINSLGVKRAMIVHGDDGFDELSMSSTSFVCELNNGKSRMYDIDPREYGFELCSEKDVQGGVPQMNAKMLTNVLKGERGAKRDIVLLNAAAGLYIGGKVRNLYDGIELAKKQIDDGAALRVLNGLRENSNI